LFGTESVQLGKVPHDRDARRKALARRRHAPSKRSENELLSRARSLTRKFDYFTGFNTAHPMRNHDFLERDLRTQLTHLRRYIFDCFCRLRRAAQPGADVVAKMRQPRVSVVACQRCISDPFKLRVERARAVKARGEHGPSAVGRKSQRSHDRSRRKQDQEKVLRSMAMRSREAQKARR